MFDALGIFISISFIVLGFMSISHTDKMYKYNITNTKYLPVILNLFTKGNLSENKKLGLIFVKAWGILEIIIGTITLVAITMQDIN